MDSYYCQTKLSLDNFISSGLPQSNYFFKALSQVKLACARANIELGYIQQPLSTTLLTVLQEMIEGKYFEEFVTDPLQGGAGTSTNFNINEIVAKHCDELLGAKLADPLEHVNLHQSTNDVYPTAVKVAVYNYLLDLETSLNNLLQSLQAKEAEFASVVKIARTELMPAIPYTLGKEFSAFADMIARDRWRIFKCQERVRQHNLGGTAIGTGLTAPKKYINLVNEKLREVTGLPMARAENLVDATQNHDQLGEVFGLLKVLAMDLEKLSRDLRLLVAFEEISIPAVQKGSTIMPGKTNPVILEMISLIAKKVIGNELSSTLAIAGGELELNAFFPLVAYMLFESCDILTKGINKLNEKCIKGITANAAKSWENLLDSASCSALLIPVIGYNKAQEVANHMLQGKVNLIEAVKELKVMDEKELNNLLLPERLLKLGHD